MRKLIGAFAVSLMLSGCGAQQVTTVPVTPAELDTVSVSGKSEVKVVPDKASLNAGVMFTADTAEEANKRLTENVDSVVNALKSAGVSEKDISTDYYSVDPDYKWTNDERVFKGYTGNASLTVSGIDMDDVTSIISTVMSAGADSVGSIRYYSSTYKESYDEALNLAISEAREKADNMGEAAGFKVVRVHDINEGYQNTQARYVTNSVKMAETVAEDSVAISPGEISIEAQVNVTYVIE